MATGSAISVTYRAYQRDGRDNQPPTRYGEQHFRAVEASSHVAENCETERLVERYRLPHLANSVFYRREIAGLRRSPHLRSASVHVLGRSSALVKLGGRGSDDVKRPTRRCSALASRRTGTVAVRQLRERAWFVDSVLRSLDEWLEIDSKSGQ